MIPSGGGLPLAVPALPLPPPPHATHCSRDPCTNAHCAPARARRDGRAVLGRRRQWRRPLPRQQRRMSAPALDWSAAALRRRRSLCRGARRASRVRLWVCVSVWGAEGRVLVGGLELSPSYGRVVLFPVLERPFTNCPVYSSFMFSFSVSYEKWSVGHRPLDTPGP